MTNIWVYDVEAEQIEKICNKYDITAAELIEALLTNITKEELKEILPSF